METVPEEPEENLPTKSEAGTDPLEPADQDPSNTEPDSGQSEKEGPSKVDAGTDPPEEEEAGPSQAKMEEPATRKTPDLSQRGSRSLVPTEDEVDTSKMKYVEGVQCAVVDVTDTGFTMPEVIIMEGQGILFEKGGRKTVEIVQVIHDGDSLRPVIGGFGSKDSKVKDKEDNYIQQFNLEGEYKFAVDKVRCTPLTVIVKRRLPLRASVTDKGFQPKIIAIDQGDTIEWSWKECTVPHSIQEVNYLLDKGVFVKTQWQDGGSNVVRTITGNFSKKFPRPGIYYFQTESSELHKQHFCIVRVRQSVREYKVEISDRAFHPPVLLIETGDRVWWFWDKFKCKKHHCVYQIEAPALNQDDEEPYQPVQNGFRWSQPSKQGLLSHVFTEPGVFYYSDQNFQEAAEYIGTVIVKPKPKEHRVMITENGFDPEIVRIRTGERIWFYWNPIVFSKKSIQVLLKEIEKCLNPTTKRPATPDDESKYQHPDEETVKLVTDVGFATVFYSTTGVYHYRVRNSNVCSVIVSPGEKNHTIHLTDSGPEQKVIMSVRPNDRVWWVWQSTKKQHNVIQVSHQGNPIPGGFCSGMARDSPSAFVHTFQSPGVFYYKSESLPKIFGAVVVTTQPVVHEVEVGPIIRPDPISVKVHDIVCWIFSSPQKENVLEIDHPDQVLENLKCEGVSPRCCLSKAIDRTGVLHFFSKSFNKQKKSIDNYLEDARFSSVISDERYDNTVIKLDKQGFHPHFVYVQKGESVRWSWINSEEEHNIIHVTSPDSKEPLNVVSGVKSFNSGKPVKNNSFLYTFDELGNFTVASQGAPGYACTVNVISTAEHVKEPTISSNSINGGTIDQFSKIELTCETLGSKIFYTTDGSPPELHIESAKLYNPEKGVVLRKHGLCFIRAMAVKEGLLNSSIFTSKRYWILPKEGTTEDTGSSSETESSDQTQKKVPQKNDNWDWWSCAPTIKACFTDPGVMEVFWEEPNAVQKKLIKGYQIFLNGVSYCDIFPATNNSLNITGLAGNRLYEVYVEVYSVDKKLNPQTSNKLTMKVPLMTKEGGPVISLERANKPDALVVVWMSIDTTEYPIKGYLVFLNQQQCGSMLVPDPDKNRCKVFIGGCELEKEHKIYVVALPKDGSIDNVEDGRMSNVIEVVLPLETSQIKLPSEDERQDQEELYQEYIVIQEGSGYLTAMDVKGHHIETNNVPPLTTTYQYTSSKRTTDDKKSGAPHVVEVEDPRHRGVQPLKKRSNLQSKTPDLMSSSASHNASHPMSADTYRNLPTPLPDALFPDGYTTPALESQSQIRPQSHAQSLADRIAERQRQRSVEIVNEHLNSRANSRANSEYYGGEPGSRDISRRSSQKSFFQHPASSSMAGQYSDINPMVQRRLSLNMQRPETAQTVMHSVYSSGPQTQVIQAPPQLNVTAAHGQQIIDMEKPRRANHYSIRSVGNIATLRPKPVNLEVQKYKYPLSFKMVASAVKDFLTQQKIVMTAIAPGRIKKRFNFDWARFRTWINVTKPFEKQKEEKMYQLQAPASMPASQEPENLPSEFYINQQEADILRERQLNFMRQQFDPDLYPEHMGGRFTQGYEHHPGEPPRSSRSARARYGQYLDVDRQARLDAYGRSYEGQSPERAAGRRSPRFEFYSQEEGGRHSPYRRGSRSRSHSHSQERRREMGPYDDWFEFRSRNRPDPLRSARDFDSGFERNSHDEKHSRDHGFYESESDYDEEYEDIMYSDDYESPPYHGQENRRNRKRGHSNQGEPNLPQSPRRFYDASSPGRNQPRYKEENLRSHRDRSPEERQRQKIKSRGFDTDFGIYGGPGARPPPLTLKEYNEEQRKSKKKRGKKRSMRRSALYDMLDQDVEYPPELPPALRTLATYGKMFHGQLLQDAIQIDHEETSDDQSMMTDDNYEKGTQTPRGKSKVKTLRDSYGSGDFSEERAQSRRAQRSESESETESETGSSETDSETESETDSQGTRLSNEGSVVVVSMKDAKYAQKVTSESMQQSRPKSGHIVRGYKSDSASQSDYAPRPPSARRYRDTYSARSDMSPRSVRRAIIEVEETASVDLNEDRMMKSVVVSQDKGHRRRLVQEGEPVYNPANDAQVGVPAPTIKVSSMGKRGLIVEWYIDNREESEYEVQQYIVNIVGRDFSAADINSHISFECNLVDNRGHGIRGTQHCWTMDGNKHKINIQGLYPDNTYRVFVVANYGFRDDEEDQKPIEVQATSPVIYYTTIGPPLPPFVRVLNVGLYQATVQWDPPRLQSGLELLGYKIFVDNKVLRGLQRRDTRQMVINDLVPGKTIGVSVVAVLKQSNIESEPSRQVHITCPKRPPPPHISQQPLHKHGSVLIAWDKPGGFRRAVAQEGITSYRIYLNDKFFGKIDASTKMDRQGYQYVITGLNPEESYDVKVKSMTGQKQVDPDQLHIFCLSESSFSNTIPVQAPAAPKSPELRLESMTPQGIRVTWLAPQQYGEAEISGYRLLKNGKLYGHVMGPEVNAVDITGISLGDKVVLQLVALTNHPVGKLERALLEIEKDDSPRQQARLTGTDQKVFTLTKGVKTKGWTKTESTNKLEDLLLGEKYAGCRPGPKLTVHYTGLVKAPDDVWLEQVTGHSALVVWKKEDNVHGHFVRPDHYVVTWWCGDKNDVQSEETREDHILITGLHPATTYTIVVEARRMENYRVEGEENDTTNKFILTAQSDTLTLRTARPPDPPSNLSIAASTCNALRLVWDPPVEHGVEIIAIRIDAQSINTSDPHHVAVEVRPDECKADIENLREKTDYVLRVTAVTDEYFDRLPEKHKLKKLRAIPRDRMVAADDSIWLPNTYTMAKTAGTEPPANLKILQSSTSGLSVTWLLPIVYGSNKLIGQVLRWSDVKNSKKGESEWYVASHINLDPADNNVTIEDLTPGAQYKIVVEAVVSIKTSLESAENDKDIQRYRRTANVMSKPLFTRTRAPTEPPRVYITGYTQTTAQLYWEKPPLVSVIGKENDGRPKYLRRYLEGYKLEINDRLHSCLGPNAQSCQLTKCKPGKKYQVVLVALTCTDQGKKERKKKYKGVYRNVSLQAVDYSALLQDEDNLDPSPSDPLEIVLPKDQDGYIKSLECTFKHDEDRDNSTFGDIELRWDTQGERSDVISHIKQFNVIWSNTEERQVQTKVVTPDARKSLIPVTRLKASYDIQVEPDYFTDALHQVNQRIQLVIPGPPDAPEIFLKSVSPEEFVIEWGEPRLFGGIKVRGYQVYLNDKKVGNELSNSHRKAVIPCRPNKNYKVQLVALSDNSFYSDSAFSNTLLVSTSPHSPRLLSGEDMVREDQDMIPVKVIAVTETSIQLDWSNFLETEGVAGYKIQWSSVAQPAQREVKLSEKDSSCVINNCLPGTTHFVRLIAIDADGQILEKSKQLTVQTSAPPDSPILSVRACNFRYIAVQWEKPNTYGDALVTGYKVYVNGIVEAILNAEQMSFTFTHGKWCQEYAFQVQALTSFDKLHSKVSDPLVVVWPGCKAPTLKRLATHSSSCVKIAWEDPYLTEGVKVKHYRAVCVERDTEKEVTPSIGPIHPNTREAEFKNLKRGSYSIFLEIHLYNTGDVVCSEPLHVAPAPAPDPPLVTVTVVGLDERRALERLTCDLVNKRDRLIRKVGHKLKEIGALSNPLRAEKNRGVIEGAHTLSRIEEILEHCFTALEHYTGQLIAHVSWSCPQRQSETQVSGFKVLIDGKQYGNTMHEGVKQVRIKLGTEQPIYKLTMVSVSDKPQASSEESNGVDLLSETFRPFSFYCYHSIHNQNARWPNQGCCKYQDSVMYERQLAKKLANQGLLKRKVPPPACSLLDIFQGEYKPFLGTHNKQFPTAILFWTPWCLGSQKVMSHYARFAREAASEYNFIAVSCGVTANHASDRKSLIHSITSNGWKEHGVIWHCTSQCASAIDEASSLWKNSTAGSASRNEENGKKHVDLTEILGIAGVPTFLFIHADGYIAWHGRYSAYDYASFAAFMRHTFSEVQGVGCPVFQCDSCKNDMTIDDEALEPVLQLVKESSSSALSSLRYPQEEHRPSSPINTDPNIERLFMKKRPRSPKRHKKISVNQRPFSASNLNQTPSHYVQLLKSPYMQKTVPSPKVLNKLLRPQSGGARLG